MESFFWLVIWISVGGNSGAAIEKIPVPDEKTCLTKAVELNKTYQAAGFSLRNPQAFCVSGVHAYVLDKK